MEEKWNKVDFYLVMSKTPPTWKYMPSLYSGEQGCMGCVIRFSMQTIELAVIWAGIVTASDYGSDFNTIYELAPARPLLDTYIEV